MKLSKDDYSIIKNFFLNLALESLKDAEKDLINAGIDYKKAEERYEKFLKRKKAELATKNGSEPQELFDNPLKNSEINNSGFDGGNYRIAAKNFNGLTEEDK